MNTIDKAIRYANDVVEKSNRRNDTELYSSIISAFTSGAVAESEHWRTALDEANKRCEIAQKVIEDKNKQPRGTTSGHAGMTLNEYQTRAMETCLPSSHNVGYMLFGLFEEIGELAGIMSKGIRKREFEFNLNSFDKYTAEFSDKFDMMKKEVGDILWMLTGFCKVNGWTLEDVARANLDKLAARKDADTIVTHTDH